MAEQNLSNGGFSILDVDEQFPSARVRQTAMYQEQHEKFMALDERYRKDFLKSVEDGNCPFLPDESEAGQLIDTTIQPGVSIRNYYFGGADQPGGKVSFLFPKICRCR